LKKVKERRRGTPYLVKKGCNQKKLNPPGGVRKVRNPGVIKDPSQRKVAKKGFG